MNKKRRKNPNAGRKSNQAVLSGINKPERETWDEIHASIFYDSAEWPMIALRSLIETGADFDDYRVVRCWNILSEQFERAVLNGDADWFKRQWKAFRSLQSQNKPTFNAKVVRVLEFAVWRNPAYQSKVEGKVRK